VSQRGAVTPKEIFLLLPIPIKGTPGSAAPIRKLFPQESSTNYQNEGNEEVR